MSYEESFYEQLRDAGNALSVACHQSSVNAGWWTDLATGEPLDPRKEGPTKLLLVHSEVSEACEGLRKDCMDDKLPHRKMEEVELADAVIRIGDYAAARGYRLGDAIAEKMAYNHRRADHKPENRKLAGGKAF